MNNNIEQLNKIIKEKRENRKERIKADIELYGREVLESEEMKQAYDQTHHLWSTVAEHTLRVTASSVLICYVLRKLHINVNIPAVVIAALCHDLGMLDRSEKFSSDKEARRDHAEESVKVAHEILDDMPEMAEKIIETHMWPMGKSDAPNTVEGVVVSVADKYTAFKDLVKGSDANDTGVNNTVRRYKEKVKDAVNSMRNDTDK